MANQQRQKSSLFRGKTTNGQPAPAEPGKQGVRSGTKKLGKAYPLNRRTLTDGRMRRLIDRMGRAWRDSLGEELPVIFPAKAEQKAAYRLLSNPRVATAR